MDTLSYAYADDAHDRITALDQIVTKSGDTISITGDVSGITTVQGDGSINISVTVDNIAGGIGGQLELISESGNTGWTLFGHDLDNYGDIGNYAINLSQSSEISTLNGATGDYSFATGFNTRAIANHSFATGAYNEGKVTTKFEVGIGVDSLNRTNAFEVHDDGKVIAPNLTEQKIIEGGDHSFVTKKYIDNLLIDCGTF